VKTISKPWGHELVWAHTERYVGKILHIKAGEALSLQYHRVKDETVMVLSGSIVLRYETGYDNAADGFGSMVTLKPREAFHIPAWMVHRMIALEDSDVLEVSTPELDDVVRLEDRYGRVAS
jgi:mannose-6-phosphate isomerase